MDGRVQDVDKKRAREAHSTSRRGEFRCPLRRRRRGRRRRTTLRPRRRREPRPPWKGAHVSAVGDVHLRAGATRDQGARRSRGPKEPRHDHDDEAPRACSCSRRHMRTDFGLGSTTADRRGRYAHAAHAARRRRHVQAAHAARRRGQSKIVRRGPRGRRQRPWKRTSPQSGSARGGRRAPRRLWNDEPVRRRGRGWHRPRPTKLQRASRWRRRRRRSRRHREVRRTSRGGRHASAHAHDELQIDSSSSPRPRPRAPG
mmetsp:Transcript_25153/g.100088  ORF Transcript_25153/g.100088 Transcript_25153/m.100088 type:complete len:257 (-) Transcript_25153:87-857(-)